MWRAEETTLLETQAERWPDWLSRVPPLPWALTNTDQSFILFYFIAFFFASTDVEGAWWFSIPQGSCHLGAWCMEYAAFLSILWVWQWVGCGRWAGIAARLSLFDFTSIWKAFQFFSFLLEWEWNLKFLAVSKYQLTKLKDSQNKQLSIPESYQRPGGLINEARTSCLPRSASAPAAPALPRQRTYVCFVASW